MKYNGLATSCLSLSIFASLYLSPSFAADETKVDLKTINKALAEQQKQIDTLMQQNQSMKEKLEITGEMLSQAEGSAQSGGVSLGGYGELHYNNLDSGNEIDFHRFVLFLGHEFTDKIRLFSELELEHSIAGDGKNGEIELEQAYIEFDLSKKQQAKAGLFLVPVGILNETHEPNTFYGVERNPVEKDIIPATWWEAGIGLTGQLSTGWSYDLVYTSGLATPTTDSSAYLPRSGRQKVSEAVADSGAITGRVKWTGIPGLELAATVQHQSDLTQGQGGTSDSQSAATLLETHAIYNKGPIGVRALFAQWDLDGEDAKSIGRDQQEGWYIEPSYKILSNLGVFARYSEWDNSAGSESSTDTQKEQINAGLNYWPHEDVVLKIDIQDQEGASDNDGFNLGIGYQF